MPGKGMASAQPLTRMANGRESPQHNLPFTNGQAMEQYLIMMRSTSKVRRMMTSTSSVTHMPGKGMASAQPLTRMANGRESPQHNLPFTNGDRDILQMGYVQGRCPQRQEFGRVAV